MKFSAQKKMLSSNAFGLSWGSGADSHPLLLQPSLATVYDVAAADGTYGQYGRAERPNSLITRCDGIAASEC